MRLLGSCKLEVECSFILASKIKMPLTFGAYTFTYVAYSEESMEVAVGCVNGDEQIGSISIAPGRTATVEDNGKTISITAHAYSENRARITIVVGDSV